MDANINVSKAFTGLLQSNILNGLTGTADTSRLDEAVQQFEAFFVQSMLKSMRSASHGSGLLESDQSDFFRDWHDQQLAENLASKETFAVAKLLRGQFKGEALPPTPVASLGPTPIFRRSTYANAVDHLDQKNTTLKQLVTKEIDTAVAKQKKLATSTPQVFVQQVFPHAQRAALKLNTSADVLVAIAALETGWGAHTPKTHFSQDSFNYFGIKADNWNGSEVTNTTIEFNGYKMIEVQDKFRAYDSPSASFDDFASLLLNSTRYQNALKSSHDAKAFVEELQKAGYATDPNYAKKVISILNGSILKDALSANDKQEIAANLENTNKH